MDNKAIFMTQKDGENVPPVPVGIMVTKGNLDFKAAKSRVMTIQEESKDGEDFDINSAY